MNELIKYLVSAALFLIWMGVLFGFLVYAAISVKRKTGNIGKTSTLKSNLTLKLKSLLKVPDLSVDEKVKSGVNLYGSSRSEAS